MNFIKKRINQLTDNKKPDYILFYLSSFLIIVGIIFSYSLSIYTIQLHDYNQYHFFVRQLTSGVFGIFIMWILAHIKPDILFYKYKIGWWIFGIFFVILIIMHFLPSSIVNEVGGAKRWIKLPGFSLSPVEFFKIGFIWFLSYSFYKKFKYTKKLSFKEELKMLLPYGVVFLIVIFLVAVLQKDLGQVTVMGMILFFMLIFSGRSYKIFLLLFALVIIGGYALIVFFPHRIKRILSWWSSVQDSILNPLPAFLQNALRVKDFPEPYQVSNSLNAIKNGSYFGQGIAEGQLKLGFLSEVHTDFVLAGITEEIGIIGLSFIFLIFMLILMRILRTSRRSKNPVYHLFSLGVAILISSTLLINAYGISGIMPIKGLAVPFLSYGGSSILAVSVAIGLVLSISKNIVSEDKLIKN